eukprot:CAMPEP_0177223844 /NCGR_PEP_ID=MMETSP0367-20130122/38702_1 /TAXON_ID=447022 ORGANISM="Scrippsiella hangoei-like, Strain SHHI-4" /NCGR_SAMPLE_ID=MMETSP0367 /ASSEMBLY_ACC=CAM_ASM_000362 /LENGTH=139 /DNA_ID=CAMNT_0018673843 /DNA_START=8 /DNA_END=427 /DNA_ORIENTATION=+
MPRARFCRERIGASFGCRGAALAAAMALRPAGSCAVALLLALVGLRHAAAEGSTLPPHIASMQLNTPKPVTEAQMIEFKQDFVDVDFNHDDAMDAQEVRAHFKDGISNLELFQFFIDSDKDHTGSISLQEYVDYAAMLN